MSSAAAEEQDSGRQGVREGSPRLRAWLEQRHGARKVPLCLGAGMVGIQDATAVLGGEKREVGWRVVLATQDLVGGGRGVRN